jgi:hypothetical protein
MNPKLFSVLDSIPICLPLKWRQLFLSSYFPLNPFTFQHLPSLKEYAWNGLDSSKHCSPSLMEMAPAQRTYSAVSA